MANHKTGAQRYNDRMDKIFDRAKSEGRGLVGNSGLKGYGVNSPAMMDARNKAIHAKMKKGKEDKKMTNDLFGGGTQAMNRSIAKHYEKKLTPSVGKRRAKEIQGRS